MPKMYGRRGKAKARRTSVVNLKSPKKKGSKIVRTGGYRA